MTRVDDDSEGVTGQALLVVDAINHFSHDDADALLDSYHRRVAGMEAGLARARSARIPVSTRTMRTAAGTATGLDTSATRSSAAEEAR